MYVLTMATELEYEFALFLKNKQLAEKEYAKLAAAKYWETRGRKARVVARQRISAILSTKKNRGGK